MTVTAAWVTTATLQIAHPSNPAQNLNVGQFPSMAIVPAGDAANTWLVYGRAASSRAFACIVTSSGYTDLQAGTVLEFAWGNANQINACALPGSSKFVITSPDTGGSTYKAAVLTRSGTTLTKGTTQTLTFGASSNGFAPIVGLSATRFVDFHTASTWRVFDVSGDTITANGSGALGAGVYDAYRIDDERVFLVRSDEAVRVLKLVGSTPTATLGNVLGPYTGTWCKATGSLLSASQAFLGSPTEVADIGISGTTLTEVANPATDSVIFNSSSCCVDFVTALNDGSALAFQGIDGFCKLTAVDTTGQQITDGTYGAAGRPWPAHAAGIISAIDVDQVGGANVLRVQVRIAQLQPFVHPTAPRPRKMMLRRHPGVNA